MYFIMTLFKSTNHNVSNLHEGALYCNVFLLLRPWQPGYPVNDASKQCVKFMARPTVGLQNDNCTKKMGYVCIRNKRKY